MHVQCTWTARTKIHAYMIHCEVFQKICRRKHNDRKYHTQTKVSIQIVGTLNMQVCDSEYDITMLTYPAANLFVQFSAKMMFCVGCRLLVSYNTLLRQENELILCLNIYVFLCKQVLVTILTNQNKKSYVTFLAGLSSEFIPYIYICVSIKCVCLRIISKVRMVSYTYAPAAVHAYKNFPFYRTRKFSMHIPFYQFVFGGAYWAYENITRDS